MILSHSSLPVGIVRYMAVQVGFEPTRAFTPVGFQDRSLQPDLGTAPNCSDAKKLANSSLSISIVSISSNNLIACNAFFLSHNNTFFHLLIIYYNKYNHYFL